LVSQQNANDETAMKNQPQPTCCSAVSAHTYGVAAWMPAQDKRTKKTLISNHRLGNDTEAKQLLDLVILKII